MHYVTGGFAEYSEAEILQMMGRAGRPQFDTSATAVIMTKNKTKTKYQGLVLGSQYIESRYNESLSTYVWKLLILILLLSICGKTYQLFFALSKIQQVFTSSILILL